MPEDVPLGTPDGFTVSVSSDDVLLVARESLDVSDDGEYLAALLVSHAREEKPVEDALEEWAHETGHTLRIEGRNVNAEVENVE